MRLLRSPYGLWLALGLVFAIAGTGFDSPDEHFPTLEFAGRILFGHASLTWEWDAGLRSFFQPCLLAAWLKPFIALGIDSRMWLDSIARIFNVLWFFPAIWAVGRISGKTAQWWVAAAWPLAVWGTRHGSDTFGIPLMLAGFAFFLTGARPLVAGLLLGGAFEARFTTGLFSVLGVGVATFLTRQTKLKQALLAGAGFIIATALLELGDWSGYVWLSGVGKIPAWNFFKFNILGGSGAFHASPWYELLLYNLVFWVPAFGWLALRRLNRPGPERWAILTWVASTLAFMCIKHKELRFILPLIPVGCIATAGLLRGWEIRAAAAMNALMLVATFLLYRDPHGALVRALDIGTSDGGELQLSGNVPNFPEFYVRSGGTIHFISDDEARKACSEKRPGTYVTSEVCGSCNLLAEIDPGLGYRLRQRVSSTPLFRYVSRCP